jgi:hypothetical protein
MLWSKVDLLREVFGQQYVVKSAEVQAVKEHAPGVVRNPHDPDAQRLEESKRQHHFGLRT